MYVSKNYDMFLCTDDKDINFAFFDDAVCNNLQVDFKVFPCHAVNVYKCQDQECNFADLSLASPVTQSQHCPASV